MVVPIMSNGTYSAESRYSLVMAEIQFDYENKKAIRCPGNSYIRNA